jgi:hypothetical protein
MKALALDDLGEALADGVAVMLPFMRHAHGARVP